MKNAKLKAVREGSDALLRLRQAVGALGRGFQIEPLFDNDIEAWDGADILVSITLPKENPLLPRNNDAHVQASRFGPSHDFKAGKKRLQGRQEKSLRQARRESKAG